MKAVGDVTPAERVIFKAAREERKALWDQRYRQKPPIRYSLEEEDAIVLRRMQERLGVSRARFTELGLWQLGQDLSDPPTEEPTP